MGFWPFGHSKKSRQRKSEDQERSLLEKAHTADMTRQERAALQKAMGRPSRADSASRRGDQRKLSKTRPGYASDVPRSQTAPLRGPNDANPETGRGSSMGPRRHHNLYQQNPISQSSIGPENFTAIPQIPTLYARRGDFDPSMPRKKSSKRKAEDHARERELRASTRSERVPNKLKRPATYNGSGPLQRDTRNVPGDMNKHLHRPTSQVSLPTKDNVSETDESITASSFKVGMLAALSPRPTIKYDSNPRSAVGKQPARLPTLPQSADEDDEDLSSKKRIDELADGLNSTALRELMEKDRRRKERKKESDKAKLQRKLHKQREKQREEETRRIRTEEFASRSRANLREREAPHNAGEGPSSPVAEQHKREVAAEGAVPAEDPFQDPSDSKKPTAQPIRNPFEDENDMDVMQELPTEDTDPKEPIPVKSARHKVTSTEAEPEPMPSQAALSLPPRHPEKPSDGQSIPQASGLAREQTPEVPEASDRDRRSSDQSSQHLGSWTSFFKRGTHRKGSAPERGRITPSEFSNTSRESFARKQPPSLVTSGRTFRRSESATPQRTMSKFREDLPEYPISPPDSRVQSPEAELHRDGPPSHSLKQPDTSAPGTVESRSLATSSSIPTLEKSRADSRLPSGISEDVDMTNAASSRHAVSQSLASVDSEGSWLSGKPVKRFSNPLSQTSRHNEHSGVPGGSHADDNEDDDITHDEYLSRLTPAPEDRRQSGISTDRRASSTLIDLQQEREGPSAPEVPPLPRPTDHGETWHDSVGQKPKVVQSATRAKSREGLLKDFQKAESGSLSGEESPTGESGEEDVPIMRARSVEYKGHARRVSAGSARLLDIRRSSVADTATPPRSPAHPKVTGGVSKGEEEAVPKPE